MVQIPPSIRIGASVSIEMQTADGAREYRSRIEDIEQGMLHVSMPSEKGQPVLIPAGQYVTLSVTTATGANLFVESEVMGRRMQPVPVVIARPISIESNQQRLFHRVNVRIEPAGIWHWLGQGDPPVTSKPTADTASWQLVKGTILDLSGGGLGMLSEADLPKEAWVHIKFPLPISAELVDARGKVMMARPRPHGTETRYQLGVKFEGLSKQDQERIVRANTQHQLEERRKARGL
jgi:c-di-GMP-binding flagellar brake protein YcgR